MSERSTDNLPKFNLGEAIKVIPNLNLVDVMGEANTRISIDGVGVAEVCFRRHWDDWDSESISGLTPAGPVEAKVIIEHGLANKMESPLMLVVFIRDLPYYDLESIKCEYRYKDKVFYGMPIYDDAELKSDGTADLVFHLWGTDDSDYIGSEDLFLPTDIRVFEDSEFIFRRGLKPVARG